VIAKGVSAAKTYNGRPPRWWQKILGIEDWRIDVEFMPRQKFVDAFGPGRAGYCDATQTRKWASVSVNLAPEDKSDPEHTLVHEEYHALANDVWMGILRIMDNFITDKHTYEYVKDDMSAKMEVLTDKTTSAMMRLKAMGERLKAKTGV
jgi:hypothetical protein